MRRWFQLHFEAPEAGGAPEAVEPVEPVEQPVDPALSDTAAEQQAWALSQSDWEATLSYLQQTAPLLQQVQHMMASGQLQPQAAPQPAEPPVPEYDPFEPESVAAYIQQSVERGVQQSMGPYQQMFNTIAEQEGQRLANSQMDALVGEIGDFDKDAVYMIAAGALSDESLNPNDVLRSAARYMHEFEQRIRASEREAYKAELQGLQGNPTDPPIGSAAAQETEDVPTGPRRYHEAVERALARRSPTLPVG